MSELQPKGPEVAPQSAESNEQSRRNLEQLQKLGKEAEDHSPEAVTELRAQVAEKAVSGKEVSVGENESTPQASPLGVQRELKADAYKRSMKRIESKLSAPEKAFSKFAHQPVIDKVSDLTGKSLVRPSGIIGGGLVSLLGSAYLLYIAKHIGFTYNYFVFVLLFAGGFVVGIVAELLIKRFKRS